MATRKKAAKKVSAKDNPLRAKYVPVPGRRFTLSEEEYHEHVNSYDGLCQACGEWTTGDVEGDAEDRDCEMCCIEGSVVGAENALVMDLLEFSEGEYDDVG